jgi:hypothetical protein
MSKKNLVLRDCDASRASMLAAEIGKVRCWLTGFHAARQAPNGLYAGVAGEDALRQIQIILKDSISKSDAR